MDNYLDTAKRMNISAITLHNSMEYHNSCYLAGYVVECYAKIIIQEYSSISPRIYNHNIPNLNTAIQHILGGNSTLSVYILNGPTDFANIYSSWNPVNLRYIEAANQLSAATSNLFQNEMRLAMQKIAQLEADGII